MKTSSVWFKALLLVAVFGGVASASQVGAATTILASSRTNKSAGHHGGVSSHIVLPSHTLVSGAKEHGTLVIGNNTGHSIHWNCAYLEVQLTNAHRPLEMHPTPCGPPRTLHVGTTRLPFTLWASQNVCEGSCTALPPGTYHTRVFPGVPAVVHPAAITVHVVAKANPAKPSVTGRLWIAGGPPPGESHYAIGRVRAIHAGKAVQTVHTSARGFFSLHLAPGYYRLRGQAAGLEKFGYSCGGQIIHVVHKLRNLRVVCAIS